MIQQVQRAAGAISIVSLALVLGGCQILGLGGARSARAAPAHEESAIVELGGEQIAAGRTALADGRTMDAINAFMIAKAYPQHRPAAYNGLAIAYSRLGREDLAERFFLTAVALSPDDTKYRSNLALFYVRQGIPRDGGAALALVPVEAVVGELPAVALAAETAVVEEPPQATRGGVKARNPVSLLRRVSAAEVHIDTARKAPQVTVGDERPAVVNVGRGTLRVPAAARVVRTAARPTYPIRIPLGD